MVVQNLTSWLKKIVPRDAQCSETDILVQEFFFSVAMFSYYDMVEFLLNIRSELAWDLRDFCEPDSETLTSDT